MAYAIWDEESNSGYLHIGEAEKLIVVKAPSLDASTVLTLKTWGIPRELLAFSPHWNAEETELQWQ